MVTAIGSFEEKVAQFLTRRDPFRVGEQQYRLDEIWLNPAKDGRTLYVSFQVVSVPRDDEVPPDPYYDLPGSHRPEVHRGEPPRERELRFRVEIPAAAVDEEHFEEEDDRLEHHGARIYYYTFTDHRSDDENWLRFQTFLDANVASPESIQAENRRAWAEAMAEVKQSRTVSAHALSPAILSQQKAYSEKSEDNLFAGRQLLALYYLAGIVAFTATNLLVFFLARLHASLGPFGTAPVVCMVGSVSAVAMLVVLKRFATRAQRDYTAGLIYGEAGLQLVQPLWSDLREHGAPGSERKGGPSQNHADLDLPEADLASYVEVRIACAERYASLTLRRAQVPVAIFDRASKSAQIAILYD